MRREITIPCRTCPNDIRTEDQTCAACGRAVTEEERALLRERQQAGNPRRLIEEKKQAHARGQKVQTGAKWIGVLAVLFVIGGVLSFSLQQTMASMTLDKLANFREDEVLPPINGKVYTAGQLRAEVEREPYQVLIVNLIVAGLMAVLWVWGRRAPLPAIACAAALFVVVHVGSALVDPATIAQGVIIKIMALVALGKGLKAALEARAVLRRQSA